MVEISLEPPQRPGDEGEASLGEQISRITHERGSFARLTESQLSDAIASGADAAGSDALGGSAEKPALDSRRTDDESFMDTDSPVPGSANAEVADPAESGSGEDTAITATGGSAETEEAAATSASGTEAQPKSYEELRAALSQQIAAALNESALNLDFVSLLVSASRPQAGASSMSPALKAQIPPGTLNADTVEAPVPTVSPHSGYGWKVSSYARAADRLRAAGERTRGEVKREAAFWRDVRIITQHGENVNRRMGIEYGFAASGSTYFDRGIGKLERDPSTGSAIFIPRSPLEDKLVRVSLWKADIDTDAQTESRPGTTDTASSNAARRRVSSTLDSKAGSFQKQSDSAANNRDMSSADNGALISSAVVAPVGIEGLPEPLKSIRAERYRLFENELMYSLIQEARTDLGAHRVRLYGGRVVCDLFVTRLEMELVDAATAAEVTNDGPALAVAHSIHLLLTQRYAENFTARHAFPHPLKSSAATPKPTGGVLKPVLALIHHSIILARAKRLIDVMLPNASVKLENVSALSLDAHPEAAFHIQRDGSSGADAESEIVVYVRSSIENAERPVFSVETMDTPSRRSEFYDLTELELWLKWVSH